MSVTGTTSPEKPGGKAIPYRAAFVIGRSGTAANQSAATVTPLTWTSAFAGTASFAWKLDGTTPTSSDIAPATGAGTLTLADSGRQLRLPAGWRARTDPATGLTIAKRPPYFLQREDAPAAAFIASLGTQVRADLGVLQRSGTLSSQHVYLKDWSGAVAPLSAMLTPVVVGGNAGAAVNTIGVTGDSITLEVRNSAQMP